MYFLDNIEQLTSAKISKIIFTYRGNELPLLEKCKKYYDGEQQITKKWVSDASKPCNKLVVNYCEDIVHNYQGYLSGIPISYASADDITGLLGIMKYNDYHNEDNELLENALVYGVAYEVNYLDEMAQQRFKILDSREVIPIYSNDLEQRLLAVIRMYSGNDLDDFSKCFVDVYTDTDIYHYKSDMSYSALKLLEVKPHFYGQVPVTVFNLNSRNQSIFYQIMSLQDAYNNLISAHTDDYEAFVDAYMVLKEVTADADDLAQMKQDRVLLLDKDAEAAYLTKQGDSTVIQGLLSTIEKQIQKMAKSPDFTDESFGTASGIAIQYKLTGMENNAANIESNMRKALQKRLELICAIQKLTADDFGWRDIDIVFTRNLPVNYLEQAQLVNQLRGLVSDKTLLAQIPFVKDIDAELEMLNEQNGASNQYNFNLEETNEDL